MGQYDADWPEIEAEWYYEKSGNIKKQACTEGGFELSNIENNSWIRFANVDISSTPTLFTARVGNIGGSGSIEVRLDSLNGLLLGEVFVNKAINVSGYSSVSCNLIPTSRKRDVYLRFKGNDATLFNLNKFSFSNQGETSTNSIQIEKLKAFPNPSKSGTFNLNRTENWTVMSNLGQNIAAGQSAVVDLSDQTKGMYLLMTNNSTLKLIFD